MSIRDASDNVNKSTIASQIKENNPTKFKSPPMIREPRVVALHFPPEELDTHGTQGTSGTSKHGHLMSPGSNTILPSTLKKQEPSPFLPT